MIEDIGHVMASALKAQFEKTTVFKRFTAWINQGAKCLRQTELAFLTPPKLRSKGRFQSISPLGKWSEKIRDVLFSKDPTKESDVVTKLRKALPDFSQLSAFIACFAHATKVVALVMKILKHNGLEQASYEQCYQLSQTLSSKSKIKKRLETWLPRHIKIQQQITSLPLSVSSDIIESLFGNFKHIIERSPQADMNRSTLLIPVFCGKLDEQAITQALNQASQNDLNNWEQENISYTLRKKRLAFFTEGDIQKVGVTNPP